MIMEGDPKNGSLFRKKQRSQVPIFICISLILLYGSTLSLAASQGDVNNPKIANSAVTEESTYTTPSEKTSNAIPEAEVGSLNILKKYGTKKSETEGRHATQLEIPFPYTYKSQSEIHKKSAALGSDRLDNSIQQQNNRSDSPSDLGTLNGSLVLSISELNASTTTESVSSTETSATTVTSTATTILETTNPSVPTSSATSEVSTTVESTGTTTYVTDTEETTDTNFMSDTTTIISSSSVLGQSDETTTVEDERLTTTPVISTIQNTQPTEKLSSTSEENPTIGNELSTNSEDLTISTTTSTVTPIILSNRPLEELSTDISDIASTTTELPTTISPEESSTVTMSVRLPIVTTTSETVEPITQNPTLMPSTNMRVTVVTPMNLTTSKTKMTTTTTTTTTTSTTSTTTTTTTTAPTTIAIVATTEPLTTSIPVKSVSTKSVVPDTYTTVSTWQDENLESTTDAISPTLPTEDVTLLIRIVLEGSWHDICSKLPVLRQSLADLANSYEKKLSPGQIVFHQTQCSDNLTPKSLMSEVPLTSLLVYIVDENGSFDGALTKILPSLYEMSPINFPLTIHSFVLVQETDSGNAIAVVIVSCVAFICLILLAGLLFIMRKRQGRFNYGERCRPVSLDAYSLDSVGSAYNSVRRSKAGLRCSKRSYGNPTFEDSSVVPSHPLNFAGLSSFCNDTNGIAEEFAGIPQVSSKIDELPAGAELKNRYANVIPLPETRVPLQRLNNDPLTEYINASYVRGPKNATKYYIACQAPTDNTVADFWRMIWEQQCKVIIMLTDLVENGVEKCTEYIPPLEVTDCHRLFGDYQVTLRKREAKEKYAISSLQLKNLENNTFREVWHIWYLWPVNGVPTDGAGLIAVLLEARAFQRGASGPTVVHCSPGTGRTGTLIALDLAIRQYEITRTVDVPRAVYTIRRDRAGAVQTREQYAFIYKALNLYASKLAGGAIESA